MKPQLNFAQLFFLENHSKVGSIVGHSCRWIDKFNFFFLLLPRLSRVCIGLLTKHVHHHYLNRSNEWFIPVRLVAATWARLVFIWFLFAFTAYFSICPKWINTDRGYRHRDLMYATGIENMIRGRGESKGERAKKLGHWGKAQYSKYVLRKGKEFTLMFTFCHYQSCASILLKLLCVWLTPEAFQECCPIRNFLFVWVGWA